MSEENVAIVRRGYEAWNRGDLDQISRMVAESFEWREAAEVPGAGTQRGRAEFDHYLRSFSHFWHEFEFEPIEIRDAGDRVLAVVTERGRSAHNAVDVSQLFMHVWLREGKAVRLEGFYDKGAAVEAGRRNLHATSRCGGRPPRRFAGNLRDCCSECLACENLRPCRTAFRRPGPTAAVGVAAMRSRTRRAPRPSHRRG